MRNRSPLGAIGQRNEMGLLLFSEKALLRYIVIMGILTNTAQLFVCLSERKVSTNSVDVVDCTLDGMNN